MAKAAAGKVRAATVVDPEQEALATIPELQLAVTDGGAIATFVQGLVRGFMVGQQLEKAALETLERAKHLQPATTLAEDQRLQLFIKTANDHKKEIEGHWSICAKVHAFHRRLTAFRDRGVSADEEAAAIANRHHNAYVQGEKQRTEAENTRRRLEAEEQARQKRQRELDEMERQAVLAESASASLSEREQHFVDLIANGYNSPAASARAAGFKDPEKAGDRLMGQAKITAAIEARKQATAIRYQALARKDAPVEVEIEEVKAQVSNSITHDRETWSGQVLDARMLVDAFLSGKHGIPSDLFVEYVLGKGQAKLNEYARSLKERLDWPGVRAVKKVTAV